jgi:hypothetical protein
MKRSRQAAPFINVRTQENRTPTGQRTGLKALRAALYYAYGRPKEAQLENRPRGEWLGPDGRARSHEAVMAWVKEQAMRHRYTFQGLLSVPQGELTAAEFCRAMQQGDQAGDWRLIAHTDTGHRHAHVLWFGDRRLDKKSFLSWQAEVRAELARLAQEPSPAARLALAAGQASDPAEPPAEMEMGRPAARGQEMSFG